MDGGVFSAANCFGGAYDDNDHDGLGDQCEWALAKRFAPIMINDSIAGDNVGGDPYWAARPNGDSTVVIVYFPAYYSDNGCYEGITCAPFDNGHKGDSEAIGIDISWSSETQHWTVIAVSLSEHHTYANYTGTSYAEGLEYPTEVGGPFNVHVSWGKHANFATRSDCSGGVFSEDYCSNGLSYGDTLYVGSERNLGSYSYPLHDCVLSTIPYDDFEECFWSGEYFLGWNSGPGTTSPYSDRLQYFGFFPI